MGDRAGSSPVARIIVKVTTYVYKIRAVSYTHLIGYGDVNGDGKIDDLDKDKLIAALKGQEAGGSCDLNEDQQVDLADLQYFTANYQAAPLEAVPYRTDVYKRQGTW